MIPTGIQTTEAKAEIETQPVKVEAKIIKFSISFYKSFCAFYLWTHYVLFLLKNNFLFHLFFNLKSRLAFFSSIYLK